jgi:hypothetical protein
MESTSKVTWQLAYDRLWLKFSGQEFTFEDALKVIFNRKNHDAKNVKYGSKLLNEMEDKGYAVDRKADYDQRVRLYRLLHPEMVSNAWAIFDILTREKKTLSSDDILDGAKKFAGWDYMFIKDTALAKWANNYYSVEVPQVSVSRKVLDGWISLLKLQGLHVIADGILVSEAKRKGIARVQLFSDLDDRMHQKGNHYQNLSYAILEGIRDHNISGALAALYIQRKKVEWNVLIKISAKTGTLNRLGFLLETLNFEVGKQIFDNKIIKKIMSLKSKELEVVEAVGEPYRTDAYEELEKKWHVRCEQAGVFRKIVEDLIR